MPKIYRVYSGSDGKSHFAELPLEMKPFKDVEGSYGEAAPTQAATGITFRMSPPGYVLDWHCAPRRQYSATAPSPASAPATSSSPRISPARVTSPAWSAPNPVSTRSSP